MNYEYTKVIDQLALCFNALEHLDETELADKVKEVIKELENINSDLCSCGSPIHPDYDGYCSDCG
jgi:hypothetical protein